MCLVHEVKLRLKLAGHPCLTWTINPWVCLLPSHFHTFDTMWGCLNIIWKNGLSLDSLYFNIDNPFFDTLLPFIYPKELLLNKTNESNFSAPFLDLDNSINNGIISSKLYDKRDDFDFATVNYPHLDGDVPRGTSYGVYILQLINFARASVEDVNIHNRTITEKLLKQGYRFNILRKLFRSSIIEIFLL